MEQFSPSETTGAGTITCPAPAIAKDVRKSSRHKPELDGIRGIAIMGVLLTHSWSFIHVTARTHPILAAMSFGMWGVDLFFALSGFLITGILLDTKQAANYFKSFYVRRFLRIFPIYYAVLALLFALALVCSWVSAHMPVRAEWASYFLYMQNVPLFWPNGFVTGHMIGHFWSLAVEEQFYCVWPVFILLLPENAVLLLCGIGLAAALPLRIYLVQHVFGWSFAAMVLTTSRMDGLLVGAAYAILVRRFRVIPMKFAAMPGAVGLLILGYKLFFHPKDQFIGSGPYMYTYGVTAIALLSGALIGLSQRHPPVLGHLLKSRALRFLGRYSYGLYVIHIPIMIVATNLIAPQIGLRLPLALVPGLLFGLFMNGTSLLLAVLSFEYFESPFLRLKSRFKPVWPPSIGL